MKSIIVPLCIIAFCIGDSTLYGSEENYFDGFVITSMGDTLEGKVQYVNPVYNELKVKFKPEDGRWTTFNPDELVEYAFQFPDYKKGKRKKSKKWVHYYRKRVNTSPIDKITETETLFLQKVAEGNITLYNYFSLKTDKIHNREYNREYFVEQMTPDGFELTYINRKNFRATAKELLASNAILLKKLGTYGYGYKYFVKIVKLHNRIMNGEKVEL